MKLEMLGVVNKAPDSGKFNYLFLLCKLVNHRFSAVHIL